MGDPKGEMLVEAIVKERLRENPVNNSLSPHFIIQNEDVIQRKSLIRKLNTEKSPNYQNNF